MKICEEFETWYKTWCPYCNAANFHCNGNESDLSGVDVDGIKCRECSKIYSLCEDEPRNVEGGIYLEVNLSQ